MRPSAELEIVGRRLEQVRGDGEQLVAHVAGAARMIAPLPITAVRLP